MEEFRDVLTELKQVLVDKRDAAGLRRTEQWIVCLDHARAHNQAAEVLGQDMQLLPHPPHSPDCNKPIEHVHSILDGNMHSWLEKWREQHQQRRPAHPTPEQCMAQLVNYFNSLSTQSIAADVATLPDTWEAIVDAQGGFINPSLS